MIPHSDSKKGPGTGGADTAPPSGSAALSLCAFLFAAVAVLCLVLFSFDIRVFAIALLCMAVGLTIRARNKHGLFLHSHARVRKDEIVPDFVNAARARIARIRATVLDCGTAEMRKQWEMIDFSMNGILQKLEQNAHGHANSRMFVNFILDSLEVIFSKYRELSYYRDSESRIDTALLDVNKSLESLSAALKKHHLDFLEGDLRDLDVELKLLRQTISCNGH